MLIRPLLLLALLGLASAAGAAPVSNEDLADLEAQADYAFYTHDVRLAARVLEGADSFGKSADPRARYQYAHAAFRRLQLASLEGDHAGVNRAGEACLAAVKPETDPASRTTEALALSAACAGYLALEGGIRGRAVALRIDGWIEAAARIAPDNPRLRLSRALVLWYRSERVADRALRAREDFEQAARALAGPRGGQAGDPSWGEADAWLYAGHAASATGDSVAARNAYERALLAAPEFGAARRALDALATGR